MKKITLILLLILFYNPKSFGQTVTLTPTAVNGVNINTGPINLGSIPNSSISLAVDVKFPAGAAVGDQGTIKIYFSKGTGLGSNVATGGNGGALYFGNGQVASRSFNINLNWTDFQTSGGYIYICRI